MLENNPQFETVNQAFPHVGERLGVFWGHAEFAPYMHSLLHDTRDGQRRGFPFEVVVALHALSEQHESAYPHLQSSGDLWSKSHLNFK